MVNHLSQYPTMPKPSFFFLVMLLIMLNAVGCNEREDLPSFQNVEVVEGFRPVYISKTEAEKIISLPTRSLQHPGKIYVYRHYLFINEVGKGIHIFDNTDPENPRPLSFLKIAGNIDMAIKGDILYADNVTDLVALDIRNIADIKIKKRIKGVYAAQMALPPQSGVYFECPDPSKGVVIGWEKAILNNPKCYR